jgi:hypothetical protein
LPHRGRWAMLSAETPSHPSSSCPSGTTSG